MLLIAGILVSLTAACTFLVIAWANGMSDAPRGQRISQWPSIVLALVAVLLFVLRHHLHGMAITW